MKSPDRRNGGRSALGVDVCARRTKGGLIRIHIRSQAARQWLTDVLTVEGLGGIRGVLTADPGLLADMEADGLKVVQV